MGDHDTVAQLSITPYREGGCQNLAWGVIDGPLAWLCLFGPVLVYHMRILRRLMPFLFFSLFLSFFLS